MFPCDVLRVTKGYVFLLQSNGSEDSNKPRSLCQEKNMNASNFISVDFLNYKVNL